MKSNRHLLLVVFCLCIYIAGVANSEPIRGVMSNGNRNDDETERWSPIQRSFAGQERQPQLDSLGGGGGVLGADRSWRKKLKKKLKNVAKKVAPIAGQLASTALKASGVPGAAQAGNMLDAGLAHGRALNEQDRQPLTESFMSGQDRKPVAARG